MKELNNVNPTFALPTPAALTKPMLGLVQLIALCAVFFAVEFVVFLVTALVQGALHLQPDFHIRRLLSEIVAWPVTLWAGLRWAKASFREACPVSLFPLRMVPALLAAAFGFTVIVWGMMLNSSFFEAQGTPNAMELPKADPIVRLLRKCIIPPLAEQAFFAGFILWSCRKLFPIRKAIWITALLFAMIQLPPGKALFMFPIGLWCVWLTVRTRSLLPGILLHATVFFTILVIYRPMVRGFVAASGWHDSPHVVPLPIIGIGLLLFVAGGLLHFRQVMHAEPAVPLGGDDACGSSRQ